MSRALLASALFFASVPARAYTDLPSKYGAGNAQWEDERSTARPSPDDEEEEATPRPLPAAPAPPAAPPSAVKGTASIMGTAADVGTPLAAPALQPGAPIPLSDERLPALYELAPPPSVIFAAQAGQPAPMPAKAELAAPMPETAGVPAGTAAAPPVPSTAMPAGPVIAPASQPAAPGAQPAAPLTTLGGTAQEAKATVQAIALLPRHMQRPGQPTHIAWQISLTQGASGPGCSATQLDIVAQTKEAPGGFFMRAVPCTVADMKVEDRGLVTSEGEFVESPAAIVAARLEVGSFTLVAERSGDRAFLEAPEDEVAWKVTAERREEEGRKPVAFQTALSFPIELKQVAFLGPMRRSR